MYNAFFVFGKHTNHTVVVYDFFGLPATKKRIFALKPANMDGEFGQQFLAAVRKKNHGPGKSVSV